MARYHMTWFLVNHQSAQSKTELSVPSDSLISSESYQTYLSELIERGLIQREKTNKKWTIRPNAKKWAAFLAELPNHPTLNVSEEHRAWIIYIMLYSEAKLLGVYDFQDHLQVSKNTILSDLKYLRKELQKNGISLHYSRKKGFLLIGKEEKCRQLAYSKIRQFLEKPEGKWLLTSWALEIDSHAYYWLHTTVATAKEVQQGFFILGQMDFIVLLLLFSRRRLSKKFPLEENFGKYLQKLAKIRQYELGDVLSEILALPEEKLEIQEHRSYYLNAVLLTISQGIVYEDGFSFLFDATGEMILELEKIAAIQFSDYRELLTNVYAHTVPTYCRILMGVQMEHPFLKDIEERYREIFSFTREVLRILEQFVNVGIEDGEVAYFALLFGAAIENERERARKQQIHALVLCPNGISTSLIVQAELRKLFPDISFTASRLHQEDEQTYAEQYDIIFSTIPVKTQVPVVQVPPIMNEREKNRIVKNVQDLNASSGIYVPTPEELFALVEPYVLLKKKQSKDEIIKKISRKMLRKIDQGGEQRPMLSELLTDETIQFYDQSIEWQAAIRLSAQPLLATQKITSGYIDAMIEKVKKYGAFIHIGKEVALPHARPEEGVQQLGMAFLRLHEPVEILDDPQHSVKILICMAAIDNETHLRALMTLTKLLSNDVLYQELLAAKTAAEIQNIIKKSESEEE